MLYNIAGSLTLRVNSSLSGYLVLKGFSKKIRTQSSQEVAKKYYELYQQFPDAATLRFLKQSSRVQNVLQIANMGRLVHWLLGKQIYISEEFWLIVQNFKVKPKSGKSDQKFNLGLARVYLVYLSRLNQRRGSYKTFKNRLRLPTFQLELVRLCKQLLFSLFVMRKLPVYLQLLEWSEAQVSLMREWLEEAVAMLKLLIEIVQQLIPSLLKKVNVYQIYQLYEKLLSTIKAVGKVVSMTPKVLYQQFGTNLPAFPFDKHENADIQKIYQENVGNQLQSAENFFKEVETDKLESQDTGQQLFDLI